MKAICFRLAGTAMAAGTLILRAIRVLRNLESVRRFYFGGQGLIWTLVELALFFGPYLAAAASIAALWLPRNRAVKLGTVTLCAAAFFTLEEGLTVFARAVNANSGYVGAEPLFSAAVCILSAVTIFCSSQKEHGKNKERNL